MTAGAPIRGRPKRFDAPAGQLRNERFLRTNAARSSQTESIPIRYAAGRKLAFRYLLLQDGCRNWSRRVAARRSIAGAAAR